MEISTYFTQQTDVKSIIIDHLQKAQVKVIVAVAWFTETELFNCLMSLMERNVGVELIITKHEFNNQSRNNYALIEKNGGFFAEIGNDDSLMHMKFCVIDYQTVISGSANWSKRAFTENNEEVTIVTNNPQRASDFHQEFERLKALSGRITENEKQLEISRVIPILDVIVAFINLGKPNHILQYVHQLDGVDGLESINSHLLSSRFDSAIKEIIAFKSQRSKLVDILAIEIAKIKSQISLISLKIEILEIEKVEIEAIVDQFCHRYILVLNPLIGKILMYKKKIYDKAKKYGIFDDTFQDIEAEFQKNNEEYDQELENEIFDLSDSEQSSLKEMYREAARLCHPDSPHCIYDDHEQASMMFSAITEAYKHNDIGKVKYLYNEVRLGKPVDSIDNYTELAFLRAKFMRLEEKYEGLIQEFEHIKSSESYNLMINAGDWDEYFESQKMLLENQLSKLRAKYGEKEK